MLIIKLQLQGCCEKVNGYKIMIGCNLKMNLK